MNEILPGRKTYLASALMAVAAFAFGMGYIDQETYNILLGILGGGGLAFLRMGVNKKED